MHGTPAACFTLLKISSVFRLLAIVLSVVLIVPAAGAQQVHEPKNRKPAWTKPCQPFRIPGNLYYVGTADLGCSLLVTPAGNVLINTGVRSSGKLIRQNIAKLGFRL